MPALPASHWSIVRIVISLRFAGPLTARQGCSQHPDWSGVRIYPRFLRPIGPSCESYTFVLRVLLRQGKGALNTPMGPS
eukprot:2085015-Pyramimonas_sp.AAC.2